MDFTKTFNVDLVSNGSMHIYPENTLSKFQNHFNPAINLDGEWEAALTEIHFPLKFSDPSDEEIEIGFEMTISQNVRKYSSQTDFTNYNFNWGSNKEFITVNSNESLGKVIEKMNNALDNCFSKFNFKGLPYKTLRPKLVLDNDLLTLTYGGYDAKSVYISEEPDSFVTEKDKLFVRKSKNIENPYLTKEYEFGYAYFLPRLLGAGNPQAEVTNNAIAYIKFDKNASKILGITPEIERKIEGDTLNNKTVSWTYKKIEDDNIFLMYVYTDIIRDHFVAGTLSPILRAVPLTKGIYEGIGYCSFEHLVYYPVRKNLIESIAILLTHDHGDQVRFASEGRVFLSLNFRKKSV